MEILEDQIWQAFPEVSAEGRVPTPLPPPSEGSSVQSVSSRFLQDCIGREGSDSAYTVSDEQRLIRFLILGSEGGTFYAKESELTNQNIACIEKLIKDGQGVVVVQTIVKVVKEGRAIRMTAPLKALAACCRCDDKKTRIAAFKAFSDVCSIPTHLFKLIGFVEKQGKTTGWGRGLRKAVSVWYNNFASDPRQLAMLVTKYRQREGWCHRDLMRLSHMKPVDPVITFIMLYTVKGLKVAKEYFFEDGDVDPEARQIKPILEYLEAVEEVRFLPPPPVKHKCTDSESDGSTEEKSAMEVDEEENSLQELDSESRNDEKPVVVEENADEHSDMVESSVVSDEIVDRVIDLIKQYDLVREHMPSFLLNIVPIWSTLLEKMPLTALVRNLNKMTMIGLLDDPDNLAKVLDKLDNRAALRMARVHPYFLLNAWHTYCLGKGLRGRLTWNANPKVTSALQQAFYASFGNVQPTNKRILIALDVSGSMSFLQIPNSLLMPSVAAAAMCLVTLNVETNVDLVAFSDKLSPMDMSKTASLDEFLKYVARIPMGGTNCSLPMLWAAEENKEYDAFIIYTDSENWCTNVSAANALKMYRKKSGIADARLVVVAMSGGSCSLADPNDLNMLDVVGFDVEAPIVMQKFISGTLYE